MGSAICGCTAQSCPNYQCSSVCFIDLSCAIQASAAGGLWGTAYRYPHQGVVLAQHSGVAGLPGAGDTPRGLSGHRQLPHEAASVSRFFTETDCSISHSSISHSSISHKFYYILAAKLLSLLNRILLHTSALHTISNH